MRRALEWLGGSVLVYALVAACAGAAGSSNDRRGVAEAEGGTDGAVAAGGVPNAPSTGGERSPDAAGLGGVLDPVPPAMAAGGDGTDAPAPAPATYTEHELPCTSQLKLSGTNFAAAVLEISPPSVTGALSVMHTGSSLAQGWLQGSTGGYVKPDGSQLAVTCTGADDVVTFYVPN